jgi:thiamine transport system substrate-binding protein
MITWIILAGSFLALTARADTALVVYAYDSFLGKGSLGEKVAVQWERSGGGKTEFVSFGSAGEALNQIALEGEHTRADLVVGIDAGLLSRAVATGALAAAPQGVEAAVPSELRFDPGHRVIPFDYGYLSFVYDRRRRSPPEGMSLRDFSRSPLFAHRLAIEDPRTSSLGLAFLLGTQQLFPDAFDDFWRALSGRILTVSPGWSGAYGLFLKKQADFVLSYTTSPAYHEEKEGTTSFAAMVFPEGNIRQIEGVAVVARSPRAASAWRWVQCLLSEPVQREVPGLQWMYPVRAGTALPPSFRRLPRVPRPIALVPPTEEAKRAAIARWLRDSVNGR